MNDSHLKSLSEALLNIAVGFWINFLINAITFPHFGIPFNVWVYLQIGGFYTVTSLIVQYGIRRLFDKFSAIQSIKGSLAETIMNFGVGWIFCYITGLLVLPYYGMTSAISVTIVNTIGSITTMIRRFLFRRLFNRFGKNENLYTLALRLYNRYAQAQ